MIRVNLLTGDRKSVKKKLAFETGQKLTVACSLILVVAALLVGWRYWSLGKTSAELDANIAAAQTQTTQLRAVIAQVQQFEQRRTQLQERVNLIELLRKAQTGPVHMLDQISRSLPPMLWLTELKQGATSNDVLIDGRCTTMTGLSDFVASLEASGYFKKSVEIVSSVTDPVKTAQGELIKFQIKAVFQRPGEISSSTPGASSTPTAESKARG